MKTTRFAFALFAAAFACSSGNAAPRHNDTPAHTARPASAARTVTLDAVKKLSVGEPVTTKGFLFHFPGSGRYVVSASMCESYPPKPCDAVIELGGVNDKAAANYLDGVDTLNKPAHTLWSNRTVTITGVVSQSGLVVTTIQ